jgi:hypothetical protein
MHGTTIKTTNMLWTNKVINLKKCDRLKYYYADTIIGKFAKG